MTEQAAPSYYAVSTWLTLLVSLLLAGCVTSPAIPEPDASLPAQWPPPVQTEPARTIQGLSWRDYFASAELQRLIDEALANNRDLKLAAARLFEARAQAGLTAAERSPGLDMAGAVAAARTPGDLTSSGRASRSERYDLNLGLVNWEVDLWGRLARLDEAARAQVLAQEENQRAVRASLIADVVASWAQWLEVHERLRLLDQTWQARQRTLALIERRKEVGLATESDLLAQRGALESLRAERVALLRQRDAVLAGLTLLVGKPLAPPAGTGQIPEPAPLAAGLPSELLLARPDLRALEARLAASRANVEAARLAFLPRISLTAALGLASGSLSGLFDSGSGAWNFNPVLRLPLFDDGRREANLDLASARAHVAVAEYEKGVQAALREVHELLAAQERWREQLDAQRAAIAAQAQRLSLSEARFAAGLTGLLDVLDAQRELWAAQSAKVQTERARLVAAASLFKALGGGD